MSTAEKPSEQQERLAKSLLALKKVQARLAEVESANSEPVAIVGMGCRFPGGASDPARFWRLLRDGADAVTEIPAQRWRVDDYYDPEPGVPGKMYVRHGGFLDDVAGFDAAFFDISPREARDLDPQQRLLLEVSWAALEHAGVPPTDLANSATGVFVGAGTDDYAQLSLRSGDPMAIDTYAGTGTALCFAAGRLSYTLGLQGPSMVVETACSSSLVAVHLAIQSLRSRECDLALAGGVHLMLTPETTVYLCKVRALSPDGRCKTFDAAANGYVRGEGCGMVVLRRLSDALARGDNVLAVIRGSAVNHDGPSSGLTVPNGRAQEALLRRALTNARVQPSDLGYVEAHGTGTVLGDPIEVEALDSVLGAGRPTDAPLYIGSVKTNIGHLEPAAGIAGLIKVVLALQHGEIPPHLHLAQLNPRIAESGARVHVPTAVVPWPENGKPRAAGVSSFGLSGTNAHLIVEEAPAPRAAQAPGGPMRPWHLLTLSARDEGALRALAGAMAARLSGAAESELPNLCFTANAGRAHFEERAALAVDTAGAATSALAQFAAGETPPGLHRGRAERGQRPRVAFLFTGQGAQHVGMGRALYDAEPAFRAAIDRCDKILTPLLGRSLSSVLYPGPTDPPELLDQTAYTQPALFALAYALADLWRSFGVEPAAVLGHSVGEYAAACAAGILSLEDGLKLVAARGRLMQSLPENGAMAAVTAPVERVEQVVAPLADALAIAADNGPRSVVLSGARAALEAACARLQSEGFQVRRLQVSHAFHSPLMDPILPALRDLASQVTYLPPVVPLASNLTGALITAPGPIDADYWCRHARAPVRFAEGLRALRAEGCDVFLEIGPRPTLLGMGRAFLDAEGVGWLPSLRGDGADVRHMLDSLAALYTRGLLPRWSALAPADARRLPLPTYPFQRTAYWNERARLRLPGGAVAGAAGAPEANGTAVPAKAPAALAESTPAPSSAAAQAGGSVLLASIRAAEPDRQRAMLRDVVRRRVAAVLGLGAPASLPPRRGFFDMGMDSLMAVELREGLQKELGVPLSATMAFDRPSVDALVAHLLDALVAPSARTAARIQAARDHTAEPIAIVGVGCRFPGAHGRDAFWHDIVAGVDAIREMPSDRWSVDDYYDPNPSAAGKTYVRHGGFVDGVDLFDAQFFGISPREAAAMDPQQRMLLEVAWEALEDAGLRPDRLSGSPTGVFIGTNTSDYMQRYLERRGLASLDTHFATGNTGSVLAGRLSYVLGLQGPSLAIDTACSSSLVAVHLAVTSLRRGECDLALVGGVNLMLSPVPWVAMSRLRALSPDGRCKTFAASADGYGRGEGCGVVVLRRLSDAQASGDRILAVVLGTAVNQDGPSSGLTVPNGPAQQAVIRDALRAANVPPAEVDYLEAHGTGTSLGDPIEVQALAEVLGEGRPADRPVLLGSVKANIGHLEAAAGVAALIKTALALRHGKIPPQIHADELNPRIPWERLPVAVPRQAMDWPARGHVPTAGLSAFGFSGTNAHAVLRAAPAAAPAPAPARLPDRPAHALILSARTEEALAQQAARVAAQLDAQPADDFPDLCFSASTGRAQMQHRLAVVADTADRAHDRLRAYVSGDRSAVLCGVADAEPKGVCFLFTGQGSQYLGMGRQLFETEPVFRATLLRCDEILRPLLPAPLLSVLYPEDPGDARLDETVYTQPALFALEVALAEMCRSFGVMPAAVLGHSVGEYAAACVAGALSLEDGLSLIAARGRLMQSLPRDGAMAAVLASEDRVGSALAPHAGELSIAAVNGPEEVVISGRRAALEHVSGELTRAGVKVRPLNVSHAFHSPLMEPMLDAFATAASAAGASVPRIPHVSNITGALWPAERVLDAAYWREHVRAPVRFGAGLTALLTEGHTVFLELGPHPVLSGMGRRCAGGGSATWLSLLRKGQPDWPLVLESLAALHVRGIEPDWAAVDAGRGRRRLAFPSYPFQRKRFWFEEVDKTGVRPQASAQAAITAADAATAHPLLGARLRAALPLFEARWTADAPLVAEHRVYGLSAASPALHLSMAVAAATTALGPGDWEPADVDWPAAGPAVADGESRTVQLSLAPAGPDAGSFQIFSQSADGGDWLLHARGALRRCARAAAEPSHAAVDVEAIRARCAETVDLDGYRLRQEDRGQSWGPSLDVIEALWLGLDETLAQVRRPRPEADAAGGAALPALAAAMHAAAACVARSDAVPRVVHVESVRVCGPLAQARWAHARADHRAPGEVRADVALLDDAGRPVLRVDGMRWEPQDIALLRQATAAHLCRWLYEIAWRPLELPVGRRPPPDRPWLVLGSGGDLARALCRHLAAAGVEAIPVLLDVADAAHNGAAGDPGASAGSMGCLRSDRPQDFDELIATLQGRGALPGAILCLWSLDVMPVPVAEEGAHDEALARHMEAEQVRVCGATLHLVQALVRARLPSPPSLWLVTRGAQPALPSDDPHVVQASLWGLGRVLALEHPELWGGLIDLEARAAGAAASDTADEAALLSAVIADPAGEDQLALRAGRWYGARLQQSPAGADASRPLTLRPDATYLVTGGLDLLGLRIALWLAESGARHLVLVGTGALPEERDLAAPASDSEARRRAEVLRALRERGASVRVVHAEPGDAASIAALVADLTQGEAPLRGVVHAAGDTIDRIARDATAIALDDLRAVLRPKTTGAWLLHRLTEACPLDFFILFSSVASIWGSATLAHYAAANAFLDALSHHRKRQGVCALSINWGPWSGAGSAQRQLAQIGILSLPPAQALEAMGRLVSMAATQRTVAQIAWGRFKPIYEARQRRPLLTEMATRRADTAQGGEAATPAIERLRKADPAERADLLVDIVRADIGAVLGFEDTGSVAVQAGFFDLGMDSVMAVEFVDRLNTTFGSNLSSTVAFDYPTLEALVSYLVGEVLRLDGAGAPAPAAEQEDAKGQAMAELDHLSEDELLALLAEAVDARGGGGPFPAAK